MGSRADDSGGPGNFSGIDPTALQGMIGSFRKDGTGLHTGAAQFKAEFTKYGLDTRPLTDLIGHADWMHDQLPLLQRRHNLAIGMDRPHYQGTHLVMVDESLVTKGSLAEARKDGKALADEYKATMDKGDPLPDAYFEALSSGADDGDFLKAFYDELGPERTSWLASDLSMPENDRYRGHPDVQTQDRVLLAHTLGAYTQVAFADKTAAQQKAAWTAWLGTFGSGKEGFRSDLIMPLLDGGTQSTAFLVALGDKVFDPHRIPQPGQADDLMQGDPNSPGPWGADHYTQLFNALAKDPEASGEWYDDRHDVADAMLYIPAEVPWQLDKPKGRATAFLKVSHAATIGLRQTNEPLAEKITARMLLDNHVHMTDKDTKSVHPIAGTDALYAQIIASYWDDLEYSVTSPSGNLMWKYGPNDDKSWNNAAFLKTQDTHRRGLEVGIPLWRSLLTESARDPESAGDLTTLFQAYDQRKTDAIELSANQDNNANAYSAIKQGRMQTFYNTALKSTVDSLQGDIDTWVAETNARRQERFEQFYSIGKGTVTKGPAGGVGAVTEISTGWLDDTISSILGKDSEVDPGSAPQALQDRFSGVTGAKTTFSWQSSYHDHAMALLKQHGYRESDFPPVVVHGVRHDGNPAAYIKSPADNFLKPDGTAKAKTDLTPRQRTAMDAWLEDPAVVNRCYQGFSEGQNSASYPEQSG